MFTFLPDYYKGMVLKAYRQRVFFVASILATLVAMFALVFLIPTFVNLSARKQAALLEKTEAESRLQAGDSASVEGQVKNVEQKLEAIKKSAEGKSNLILLESVLTKSRPGILIHTVVVRRMSTTTGSINLEGKAVTRDALVGFVKSLNGEPSFTKVDLPVSSLAKSKDISFSISIESQL